MEGANRSNENLSTRQIVTVIVCTYNRCESLTRALQSIVVLKFTDFVEWEVLIVDNNSTDETRTVVEQFVSQYPGHFRYLFEPHPGKSHALNAGIRAARGDILAFLDDDVTVEPTWLENLTRSLQNDSWGGTGGRTFLQQSFTPPRWLALDGPYNMGGILAALFDLGEKPCTLERAPFGVNMAFKKRLFEKYGGFRTDLGPSPSREIPRPCEDTEFGCRVMDAGERLRYEPSAIVYHELPKSRITKEYFLTWWFDYGRAGVRILGTRPDMWGFPRHYLSMVKAVTMLGVRTLSWMFAFGSQVRFYRKCWVWKTAGEINEMYRTRFGAGSSSS